MLPSIRLPGPRELLCESITRNAGKAEKYGWLESSEQWIALRQLRNQMIHEYIENAQTLYDALTTAYANLKTLEQFETRLNNHVAELLPTNQQGA